MLKDKNSSINNNIKVNNTFIFPEGFSQWYLILDRLKNNVLDEVDSCLKDYDYYGAIEIFEENTIENKNKMWS